MMIRGRKAVLSIRWIVGGAAAVLVAGAVLGVTAVTERRTRDVLVREIEARLLLQARSLAAASSGALLTEYPEFTLAPLLNEMQSDQPELALLVVADRSGTVQGHSDVRRTGTRYAPPRDLVETPSSVPLRSKERLAGTPGMLVATVPIQDRGGQLLGHAIVGLRRSHIQEALNEIGRQQLLVLGALLAAAIACSVVLMSFLLRPISSLRAGIERIGRGELETPLALTDRTEFGLLAGAVDDMAAALKSAQTEMVERARLSHEIELAQEIQRSLLPSHPTTAGEFVIAGKQWAAAEVGGDYYDVQELPDGIVALTIADVAGKGLAGCLVSSMLFSLIRALRLTHTTPTALLVALDERLSEILRRGTFVTMFYGLLDTRTGRLTYASAGHNPVLVYRAAEKRVEWHESTGIPLCAFRGGAIATTLTDCVLDLGPGDVLVQSTDGINEAEEPLEARQFGFKGMEDLVLEAASSGAHAIVDRLHGAVDTWRGDGVPTDDETVLVVARQGLSPLRVLEEAQMSGTCLKLPARLDSLSRIDEWLREQGLVQSTPGEADILLSLTLYELSANIVEHGYANDPKQSLELWWVPDHPAPGINGGGSGRSGKILLRDQGQPFDPTDGKRANLGNRETRMRGRGLGLEIVHRSSLVVGYHAGIEAGNLTILQWNPASEVAEREELRHA